MRCARVAAVALAAALATAVPASAALPQIDYALTGPAGDGDWFRGQVTVKWTLSGETSSSGCDTRTLTSDTAGTELTCTASNTDGPVSATTRPIRIDHVAPAGVSGSAARPPDAGTWFTAPVSLTWTGTDALSGVASCTALVFAGPDDPAAAPAGVCRDRAGNVSPPVTLPLSYDATPPALGEVAATAGAGRATVRWAAGPDAAHITVVRESGDGAGTAKTVADGPAGPTELVDRGLDAGAAYTWTIIVRDAAGNAASARTAPLRPAAATTATTAARPPVLRWRAMPGARYYNVQLLRSGRKVLSAWPGRPRYTVRPRWRYGHHTVRLTRGNYSWFVWPGYGARAERRYGKLMAHGRFTVR